MQICVYATMEVLQIRVSISSHSWKLAAVVERRFAAVAVCVMTMLHGCRAEGDSSLVRRWKRCCVGGSHCANGARREIQMRVELLLRLLTVREELRLFLLVSK